MEDLQMLGQLAADLTITVVSLALLFAERKAHEATRTQLEEARREHLQDLRAIANSRPYINMPPLYNNSPGGLGDGPPGRAGQ